MIPKYLLSVFSYTQISVVLTLHQENFFYNRQKSLQNITENNNQSKYRVMEPSLNGFIFKTTSTHKVQETFWKRRQKDCESQRIREFVVRPQLCVLVMSVRICTQNFLIRSQTRTPIDMLKCVGKISQDLTIYKELQQLRNPQSSINSLPHCRNIN